MKSEKSTLLLGTILNEAGLISCHQLEVALREQNYNPDLRIGEILALHGWVKQETADFFAEDWRLHIRGLHHNPLGYYLISSGLLSASQLDYILKEQERTGMRVGAIAVLQGWVKKPTIDFFVKYLDPSELNASPFKRVKSIRQDQGTVLEDPSQTQIRTTPTHSGASGNDDDDDDVMWVG